MGDVFMGDRRILAGEILLSAGFDFFGVRFITVMEPVASRTSDDRIGL